MTFNESVASSPRGTVGGVAITAVIVQVGVLAVTFMMGVLGLFTAQNAWFVALGQAAAGLGLVGWLTARRSRWTLIAVVPIMSLALTIGLTAASATVTVACGRVLRAFEQVPPPPGVTVEPFVSFGVGCMAQTPARRGAGQGDDPSGNGKWADLFDHYRKELPRHGWSLVPDGDAGELRAERDGMYVVIYNSENRVYFDLGRCGEWGTRCGGTAAN